ncbi:MAG: response regulator [Planctomycetota bacterium]
MTAKPDDRPLVLIADDTVTVQRVVEHALRNRYRLALADDGAVALELAQRLRPAAVVSDVFMPEMSGLELVERLKADPDTRSIPVILLTGDQHDHTLVAGLGLGADDYLRKPINVEELRARVGAAVRQHQTTCELEHSVRELERTHRKLLDTQSQLVQAQKLEAIGRLAAGVAHEINTPLQYVGDNIAFMQEGATLLCDLIGRYQEIIDDVRSTPEIAERIAVLDRYVEQADLEFFLEEIPGALQQSQSGVDALSEIVRAMKEFSHPGSRDKVVTDVNKTIRNTLTVARTEWKYIADLETDLDDRLPHIPLLVAEFNQVLVNLLVNAAHAIVDASNGEVTDKGVIHVATRRGRSHIEIRIRDTGPGIPADAVDKIFDPFFTTKEVGRGSGQGLAIARSVVVDKHGGTIEFESHSGGATFVIRLPIRDPTDTDSTAPREFANPHLARG